MQSRVRPTAAWAADGLVGRTSAARLGRGAVACRGIVGEHYWDFGDDLTELEATPRGVALYLRVAEALPEDVDRGVARIDPRAMLALGLASDEVVSITGRRTTLARVADAGRGGGGQIR